MIQTNLTTIRDLLKHDSLVQIYQLISPNEEFPNLQNWVESEIHSQDFAICSFEEAFYLVYSFLSSEHKEQHIVLKLNDKESIPFLCNEAEWKQFSSATFLSPQEYMRTTHSTAI